MGTEEQRERGIVTSLDRDVAVGSPAILGAHHLLLSSVAESLYWAGRHLERAEGTARLVRTHTELFIDLPRSAGLDWAPLLAVTGSRATYDEDHDAVDEDGVVSFLLADPENPGSVLSCLARARENARVTRGFLPNRPWEIVNEAERWARHSAKAGSSRGRRVLWTEEVIRRCHAATGSINATMSRDQAYAFMMIGRQLELADMTSRVLDVGGLTMTAVGDQVGPYVDLVWMKTLRALGAEQMYRRQMGAVAAPSAAIRFLLRDRTFPRSVEHCVTGVSLLVLDLPNRHDALVAAATVQRHLDAFDGDDGVPAGLGDYLDELQVHLGALHDRLSETFFHRELVESEP